jgi:nicotinamide riboside kinase
LFPWRRGRGRFHHHLSQRLRSIQNDHCPLREEDWRSERCYLYLRVEDQRGTHLPQEPTTRS